MRCQPAWVRGARFGDGRPRSGARLAAGIVWLAFIVFPVIHAITEGGSEPGHALAIAGTIAFSALYVWLLVIWFDHSRRRQAYLISGALLVIASGLTAGVSPGWGFLFSYVAACAGLTIATPYGFWAVLGCGAASIVATVAGGGGFGTGVGYAASTLGVGLLLTLMRDLRERNAELSDARAELARTAVAAERERFARDLHDLLGHSLSVIAIKAELASRLLPATPDRAAAEVADLESVARTALGEVREAVSGYRRPTLDGELEGARIALTAAGIIAEFEHSPATLPVEVEAVLAWAVREGATNVIRHSGAQRCEVRIHAYADGAAVEVLDDGAGCTEPGTAGNGLAGLRERAAAVRGRLEAGTAAGGGFRLSVAIPAPAPEGAP